MKNWRPGCLLSVVLVFAPIGGCIVWLHNATKYYVEAYKPANAVEAKDKKILQDRFSRYEFEHATVFLEWYTYNNAKINVAPYKLFIKIEPKSPLLRSVAIESIAIESSLAHEYPFAPST